MADPAPTAPDDIAALSFEEALRELERIVADLESGQAELERSIDLYERGSRLKQHCEARLRQAQLRVERIVVGPGGEPQRTEPADFG
jgi:exodeoxyribonuclease VII small subunit